MLSDNLAGGRYERKEILQIRFNWLHLLYVAPRGSPTMQNHFACDHNNEEQGVGLLPRGSLAEISMYSCPMGGGRRVRE